MEGSAGDGNLRKFRQWGAVNAEPVHQCNFVQETSETITNLMGIVDMRVLVVITGQQRRDECVAGRVLCNPCCALAR
jgi:hypothetical protein